MKCENGFHWFDETTSTCECGFIKPNKQKLTPPEAIEALEKRFELGQQNYKDKAWNANTNQGQLDNKDWIVIRARHAEDHIVHFLDVMRGFEPDDGDDDGAAIMWLGTMLHMAYLRRKKLDIQRQGKE